MNAERKSPQVCDYSLPFSSTVTPQNSDIQPPYSQFIVPLITRLDEIICQLLDSCCCVPGYHTIFVVGNEDSHLGLDNDNTFSALHSESVSQNGFAAMQLWTSREPASQKTCTSSKCGERNKDPTFLA